MPRAIGLDLGSRRIGVAVCDSEGRVATPYEVIARSRDREADHRRIRELYDEAEAELIVVGLPLSLDGSIGPAATRAMAEVDELRRNLGVRVETQDERLSTVAAERDLLAQQLDAKQRRKVVDKVAAAVILQSWLDTPRDPPP
jgi:putative Holliday junction resolvase